ncbi:hypothetical protein EVAR_2715_1 [Eumeta japonica]|uniref:Uncharacterized protein n=1 Tax=Eumeta variegata TaxID=151549 RepID=A0A4C1SQ09_EUMVA|nr:hypothetical protein EVAR_2715_1 [Eumeta japonica]
MLNLYLSRLSGVISKKSEMSLKNKCTLQSMHPAGDEVRGASLRPCRPKRTLPTPDSAKQLLQKSLRRTLRARRRHPQITILNGHPTGALLVPHLKIQPERNLHVISCAEMPTSRHPKGNHSPMASHADRPR